MIAMKRLFPLIFLPVALACSQGSDVKVTVANDADTDGATTVELDGTAVLARLGSPCCYVVDAAGNEVPSQITHDSLLVFVAEVGAGNTAVYTVLPSDTSHVYDRRVCGRIYPERADDIAWENETGGYRIYGPATQRKGERAFGYDLFFKHATDTPVVERLYEAQTSGRNWQIVDSLRAIDPALARAFEQSFTYHVDHGLGMDCYAVGATLGAGVAAPVDADSLCFAWCYDTARILDNGPVRFTVELQFAPRTVGTDSTVVEKRIVSLDSRALLNRCKVVYDGFAAPRTIAMGFPRRDDSQAVLDPAGVIAYSDPTQGAENGRAYLGLVLPSGFDDAKEANGHILGYKTVAPADTLDYYWGFVWDANDADINIGTWADRLASYPDKMKVTIE